MNAAPSAASFGLLLGLSFFLGLAFEDFFAQAAMKRPGGDSNVPDAGSRRRRALPL